MAQRYSSWKLFEHTETHSRTTLFYYFIPFWMMTSIHVSSTPRNTRIMGNMKNEEPWLRLTAIGSAKTKNQKKKKVSQVDRSCFECLFCQGVLDEWGVLNGVCVCVNVLLLGRNERLALIAHVSLSPGRQSGHNHHASPLLTPLLLSFLFSFLFSVFLR